MALGFGLGFCVCGSMTRVGGCSRARLTTAYRLQSEVHTHVSYLTLCAHTIPRTASCTSCFVLRRRVVRCPADRMIWVGGANMPWKYTVDSEDLDVAVSVWEERISMDTVD